MTPERTRPATVVLPLTPGARSRTNRRLRCAADPPPRKRIAASTEAKGPELSTSFTVEAGYARGVYTLGVVGELDQATVPDLRARIGEAIGTGDGSILIDLSRCDFIDSTGISLLVEAQRKIEELDGRRLVVCCPGAEVRRLLDLTGVGTLLGVFDGRDKALDEVAAA